MLAGKLRYAAASYFEQYTGLEKESYFIFFLNFINSTLISVCYFLSIHFVNHMHLSVSLTSYIISLYALGTIVGGMIGGKLSDHIEPRLVSISSLFMQGIISFCLASAYAYQFFALSLLFLGMTSSAFITSTYLWALSLCSDHKERIKTINILETISNLGLGVSALIIGKLVTNNFNSLFFISGITLLIASGYAYINSSGQTSQKKIINQPHDNEKSYLENPKKPKLRLTIFSLITLFSTGAIISQLSSTYPIHINHLYHQEAVGLFSLLFTLNTFLVVLFQTPIANWCKIFNPIFIMGTGTLLLGSGMAILIFSANFSLVVLACIVYTFGEILFFSVSQLVFYENSTRDNKGRALGLYRMTYASSRVIGIVAGGYTYQHFSGNTLWTACGIIGIACFISSFLFNRLHNNITGAAN